MRTHCNGQFRLVPGIAHVTCMLAAVKNYISEKSYIQFFFHMPDSFCV